MYLLNTVDNLSLAQYYTKFFELSHNIIIKEDRHDTRQGRRVMKSTP